MNFIKLNSQDNGLVSVNVSKIAIFKDNMVSFSEKGNFILVKETAEEIQDLIDASVFYSGADNYGNTIMMRRDRMSYAVVAPTSDDEDTQDLNGVTVVGIDGASIPTGKIDSSYVMTGINRQN
jgi:hypothetical protein